MPKRKIPLRVVNGETQKFCVSCKQYKKLDLFWRMRSHQGSVSSWCKECSQESSKRFTFRKLYGISLDDFAALVKKQDGRCACCSNKFESTGGSRGKTACMDHDHRTKKNREAICGRCNTALGCIEDNPLLAQALIDYLLKHSGTDFVVETLDEEYY